jgi:hypothetical protein
MTDAKVRRAAVGFTGTQVLGLRLTDGQLSELRTALQDERQHWLEVEAVDGAVLLDLREVVYVRVESDELRVGF